jgi:hypothetical protein
MLLPYFFVDVGQNLAENVFAFINLQGFKNLEGLGCDWMRFVNFSKVSNF